VPGGFIEYKQQDMFVNGLLCVYLTRQESESY
jgi:hypothetical protein